MTSGTPNTQMRPLLILATRVPYRLGLGVIHSFELLNYVYAFVFYLAVCLLLERFGNASSLVKFGVAGNLALCIATSKMFAFYPVLIDLGALALTTLAFYLVATERKWAAGVACVLAAASREFGVVAALYGLHRAVRLEHSWRQAALTFLPSLATPILIRLWVMASAPRDRAPLSMMDAVENLEGWLSPAFVVAFAYFAITLFGGLSALLVVGARWCLKRLKEQPELITVLVVVVGLASVGSLDIWRYLVFALPVAIVLIAQYLRCCDADLTGRLLITMTLVTLLTQRPFERMDTFRYFLDWFPLYGFISEDPREAMQVMQVWSARVLSLLLLMLALSSTVRHTGRMKRLEA